MLSFRLYFGSTLVLPFWEKLLRKTSKIKCILKLFPSDWINNMYKIILIFFNFCINPAPLISTNIDHEYLYWPKFWILYPPLPSPQAYQIVLTMHYKALWTASPLLKVTFFKFPLHVTNSRKVCSVFSLRQGIFPFRLWLGDYLCFHVWGAQNGQLYHVVTRS